MSGTDTLGSIGSKVTGVFLSAFGGTPGVSLVFLPFALPAPDDVVQGGMVNPTRLASFLEPNFDAPYLVSQSQYTVHGIELSFGAASQIYTLAVSSAQPVAAVGSDIWKRVNAEIAAAQSGLSPGGVAGAMTSVPDDWIVPENTSYWSTFDSTQVSTPPAPPDPPASGGPPVPPRRINPVLWSVRAPPAQIMPAQIMHVETMAAPRATTAAASPLIPRVAMMQRPMMLAAQPSISAAAAPQAHPAAMIALNPGLLRPGLEQSLPPGAMLHHFPIGIFPHPPPPAPPPAPPPPPPPSSTMTVHFDYMSATIGFMAAGMPIWNGVFLADKGWCVPGMAKGGLLPDPNEAAAAAAPDATPPQLAYGLPISIILVRNLTISVKWTGQEQSQLGDSGFLGPFSLAGASVSAKDGTVTYARPGIQVIALTCSTLPVLPPADAPQAAAPSTPAPSAASPDAQAPPAAAPAPDAPAPATADSSPATPAAPAQPAPAPSNT